MSSNFSFSLEVLNNMVPQNNPTTEDTPSSALSSFIADLVATKFPDSAEAPIKIVEDNPRTNRNFASLQVTRPSFSNQLSFREERRWGDIGALSEDKAQGGSCCIKRPQRRESIEETKLGAGELASSSAFTTSTEPTSPPSYRMALKMVQQKYAQQPLNDQMMSQNRVDNHGSQKHRKSASC